MPSISLIDSTSVSSAGGTTRIGLSGDRMPPKQEKEPDNPHEKGVSTYARYYGNELAQDEIFKAQPKFPVGAMLVREKLLKIDDTAPQLVTVMLKREAGFNRKNGDWEYLVVDGSLAKVIKREKKGSCATCHANASQTDFVFKTYLK